MQLLPLLLSIIICILALTLIIVGFFLIRVLMQLFKLLRGVNELVGTSKINLKEMVTEIFMQLLSKVELREELIEDLAMRSVSTSKKKKKSESKQLFKGL